MSSRRRVLKAALLTGGGLLFAGGAYYRQQQKAAETATHWVSFLDYPALAAATGKRIRKSEAARQMSSITDTLDLLRQDLQITTAGLLSMSNDELLTHIQQRVRRDFSEEKVIYSDGWLLSQTEARLCVLASYI